MMISAGHLRRRWDKAGAGRVRLGRTAAVLLGGCSTLAFGALTVVEGETTGRGGEFMELARYTFDDGFAGDATGNGHHGTIFGDPSSVAGISGQALRFDGQDDWISVPHSPAFDRNDISLDVWVRVDATPTSDAVILRKMDGDIGYSLAVQGSTAAVEFTVQEGLANTGTVVAPFPLFPNVWTSIYAVYDGTELRLFLDGLPVASTSAPGLTISNTAEVTIAAAGASRDGPDRFFTGVLDEITLGAGAKSSPVICQDSLKLWDSPSQTCIEAVTDVTEALGVGDSEHVHFSVNMVDINDDGWIDLYYGNGLQNLDVPHVPDGTCPDLEDPPPVIPENSNVCYLNQGDGTFTADIAFEAGIDDGWNAMRQVWGDYDNDGRRDMLSHNFLVSPLYHAVSGPEPLLFEEASESSGLTVCLTLGTGASWVDVNNDGWLDLYAVEYNPFQAPEDHLQLMFLNNGDGTFTDITAEAGMDMPADPMGIAFADYDNDGDQDVYLTSSHIASLLYRNDGVDPFTGIPHFTDVAQEAGVTADDPQLRGFGAAWGDYDNDGRLDLLFVRDPAETRLWHNDGPDAKGVWTFSDVTDSLGVDFSDLSYHDGNFADLDNDGWLDIVLANAFFNGPVPDQPSLVFLNNRDGSWREVAATLGMDLPAIQMRGFVAGDIDNDGDVDLSLLGRDTDGGVPNFLFRNDTRGNNWIQFRLTGTVSNRDAVGARISVQAENQPGQPEVGQIREVVAGTGFFSDMPRIQTFGLGKAAVVEAATIRWPSGRLQVLGSLAINQRYDVVEPPTGDVEGDGDLDLRDFATFQSCYAGPCAPLCPLPLGPDCQLVDFDFDEDVDDEDLAAFVAVLTGPQ